MNNDDILKLADEVYSIALRIEDINIECIDYSEAKEIAVLSLKKFAEELTTIGDKRKELSSIC
jgi:hypothetical protein